MKNSHFFPVGALKLNGVIGQALKRSIRSRLTMLNYSIMVEPFKLRSENDGAWRCEFWGKVVRSAILSWRIEPDETLLKLIKQTVAEMMATQTPDGCISSYPTEKQLTGWDIWGRKYVLLALERYYQMVEQDPAVLKCCCKMVDHLMTQLPADTGDIRSYGMHDGLAASSILASIVALYDLTHDTRYLEYAKWIAGLGCATQGNIFDAALADTPPANIGNGKAYEMTSCFEGAAALSQTTNNARLADAVRHYFNCVNAYEVFVTGAAGCGDKCGEFWYNGGINQVRSDKGGLGETCVTATYLHLCDVRYELDQDSSIIDCMENSIYNALIGALAPSGDKWCHVNPTPLTGGGWKQSAPDQIMTCFKTPFDGHDCCRAQGPEGLALAAAYAVQQNTDGLTVNFCDDLDLTFSAGNTEVQLNISGGYPASDKSTLAFAMKQNASFTLRLRIPAWADKATLRLNGKAIDIQAGSYCELKREWQNKDTLELDFNMSVKPVKPAGINEYFALKYGPLVLAQCGESTVTPAIDASCAKCDGNALVNIKQGNIQLCDYASAGSKFSQDDTFRVFFPLAHENSR